MHALLTLAGPGPRRCRPHGPRSFERLRHQGGQGPAGAVRYAEAAQEAADDRIFFRSEPAARRHTLRQANDSLDGTVTSLNKAKNGAVLYATSFLWPIMIITCMVFTYMVMRLMVEAPGSKAMREHLIDEGVIVRAPWHLLRAPLAAYRPARPLSSPAAGPRVDRASSSRV